MSNSKIMSEYLGREIDVPLSEFDSDGERVVVIPFATLENIILNDPTCVENEVQYHFTQASSNLSNHFAFFCTMSDNKGRSVEGFGESLPETLDTPIAAKNPAKMAVKRAFSDAAIKFLRLPRSYSDVAGVDMEITGGDGTTKRNRKAAKKDAPVPELDAALEPDEDLAKALENAAADLPEEPKEPSETAKSTSTTKGAKNDDSTDEQQTPSDDFLNMDDGEDPFAEFPDYDESMLEAEEDKLAEELESSPDVEESVSSDKPRESDIYDTTIVNAGKLKSKNYSVRQLYEEAPDQLKWIAYTMAPRREDSKVLQKVAKDYLKMVGDED